MRPLGRDEVGGVPHPRQPAPLEEQPGGVRAAIVRRYLAQACTTSDLEGLALACLDELDDDDR